MQGLTLTTTDRFGTLEHFIRVWRNECLRVFHDRLINERDKLVTQNIIRRLIEENFTKHVDFCMRDPILYGDYRTALQVATCIKKEFFVCQM